MLGKNKAVARLTPIAAKKVITHRKKIKNCPVYESLFWKGYWHANGRDPLTTRGHEDWSKKKNTIPKRD